MGLVLPKPVMTGVLDRDGNSQFKVGSACVNGYRENMEDAHIAFLSDRWAFFGVFDGHGNDECSAYLEREWTRRLSHISSPLPKENIADVCLEIDAQFCTLESEGGSTGTFFFVFQEGNKMKLRVGNVGDSRVLACKHGNLLELTLDHKPNLPEESDRIVRCGGTVENGRVNGALAVSRAFGDKEYKAGNAGPLDQLVIAFPDIIEEELEFNSGDFALLACDGVFEGDFSNEEVIQFVSERLKASDDLAAIAHEVTKEAVRRGSKDNISCMIVLFTDGTGTPKCVDVVPGPFTAPEHSAFRKAYHDMAQRGGVGVDRVLEIRYDALRAHTAFHMDDVEEFEGVDELAYFGDGPEEGLQGSERTRWFHNLWVEGEELSQPAYQLKDLMDALRENVEGNAEEDEYNVYDSH